MYKNKYLKYKIKYLNLKGGVLTDSQKKLIRKHGLDELDELFSETTINDKTLDGIIKDTLEGKYKLAIEQSREDAELESAIKQSKESARATVELESAIKQSKESARATVELESAIKQSREDAELESAIKQSRKDAELELAIKQLRKDAEFAIEQSRKDARELVRLAALRDPQSASFEGHDTFYIYTTGIGDNALLLPLVKIWLSTYCNSITRYIPQHFKIVIQHYDPLLIFSEYDESIVKMDPLNIIKVTKEINSMLEKGKKALDSRITSHVFIPEYLPIKNLAVPHIIIDHAHIFGYYPNKEYVYLFQPESEEKNPLRIKSLYTPWNDIFWANRQLLTIKDDGTVKTYIDYLIDAKILLESTLVPYDLLYNIIELILNIQIEGIIKENLKAKDKKINLIKFFEVLKINESIIVDELLNKLYIGKNKENIENIKNYNCLEKILSDMDKVHP